MANNWQINAIAGLDGTQSRNQLNSDIKGLARNLDKLKLYTEIDKNQVTQLQHQLKNLQVQLNNVTVSDAVINGLVAKINAGLQNVNISNVNIDNIGNQARQTGEKIAQQINQGINSVVQKGSFEKIFTPDKNGINGVAKDAEKYFKTLSNTVSVEERLGNKNNLEGFTVTLKNAEGVVEQLRYKYQELKNDAGEVTSRWFEYSGGSINDNGVIKQMNAISTKADSLQTKLDKLKANYSDLNASRPIKDSGNISALSAQYDKVAQAIEAVRNADNSTFSSMVSNAQKEITTLETMVTQFRNAENVATQMKSVDISSGIAQAQERLGKLKANASGFEQMTDTIRNLDIAIEGVGDKSSLDKFINDLRTAETQLGRVKAEAKQLEQVNKIQLLSNGGIKNDYATQIAKLEGDFRSLGLAQDTIATKTQNVKNSLATLRAEFAKPVDQQNFQAIQTANDNLQRELIESRNEFEQLRASMKGMATEQQRLSLANTIEAWNQKNTAATKAVREENERYVISLRDLSNQMTRMNFNKINTGFKQNENSMRTLHKLGASLKDQFSQAATSFTQWLSVSSGIMLLVSKTKDAVVELKELDDILTEITKTSDLTEQQLKKLGDSAYDTASKYGRTASDYLTGVQEMYRAGFDNAEQMAELSVLAQSAGDMDSTLSNDYLLATNAAYKYKGSVEELNKVLDSQNYITNNAAISMKDIADATTETASVAAQYGVQIDELSALIATATANTRESGAEVGTALKAILINLQDTTSKPVTETFDALGISMTKVENGAERLKTPIELIHELADAYNSLPEGDIMRANILNEIGQKRHANTLAAVLSDMEAYNKMLELYNSNLADDSAYREAEKSANNFSGSLNKLRNTWTDTVDNILNSDTLTTGVNVLNDLLGMVNKLTDALGGLGTVGLAGGLLAGIKNVG